LKTRYHKQLISLKKKWLDFGKANAMRLIACLICLLVFETNGQVQLEICGKLDDQISESSGLVYEGPNSLWTINDGGSGAKVYNIDSTGRTLQTYVITPLKNNDWEAIYLHNGRLFIGDFGNNANKRKNLKIHSIPVSDIKAGRWSNIKTIAFKYPDQKFPTKKKDLKFDCEAMVIKGSTIYLITKNRTDPFDGDITLYTLNNNAPIQIAQAFCTYKTKGHNKLNWWITDACLQGDNLVLLSHNKIFVVDNFIKNVSTTGTLEPIDLHHFSQKESICFVRNNQFFLTDEKLKFLGGKLYTLKLP